MRRPIVWGLIGAAVGAVGWVVSVVLAVVSGGAFRTAANVFGYLMLAGIPLGLLGELIRRLRRRK